MIDLNAALASANASIAAEAQGTVVRVEQTRVLTADAAEYGGARTVTQAVTNHQLSVTDRLGMYQQPGWHGLGEVIAEELTGRQAVERFLGWVVEPRPCYTTVGEGEGMKQVPLPLRANVRSDTQAVLGVVGEDYKVVQNVDLGNFADALLSEAKEEGVGVRMETCGSLLGGRKVFLTLRPDKEIRVGKGGEDVTVPLLTLLNGHDGSLAMTACWSMVRVVCNNTFTTALGSATQDATSGRTFKVRHSGKVSDYLNSAKAALGLAVKGLEKYQQLATAMAAQAMKPDQIRSYFWDVYHDIYGCPEDVADTDAAKRAAEKRGEVVLAWTALMGDECQLIPGMAGTLWAAFNCITQWMDHTRAARMSDKAGEGKRDHLKLLGAGAVDKRKAFASAVVTLAG